MNFEFRKELPKGAHFKFVFENPAPDEPPISETLRLEIDDSGILVQSLPLECITNNTVYSVTVEIYSDKSEVDRISTHTQEVEFRLSDDVLERIGVKTC